MWDLVGLGYLKVGLEYLKVGLEYLNVGLGVFGGTWWLKWDSVGLGH